MLLYKVFKYCQEAIRFLCGFFKNCQCSVSQGLFLKHLTNASLNKSHLVLTYCCRHSHLNQQGCAVFHVLNEQLKSFFPHIFSNSSLIQISSLSEPSGPGLGTTGPMYLILEVSQELRVAGLCSHAKSVRCDELFTDMYLFVQCRVSTLKQ